MLTVKTLLTPYFLPGIALCACLGLAACDSSDSGSSASTPQSSPAPSQDDEPIAEDAAFNTAIGFPVMREPGPRLPEEEELVELTDADFEAGLPDPVVNAPEGLDTTVNQPPFFEGLSNVDVLAGQVVEIVYLPQDPEGELPGMFPEKLPQGSTFEDNLDGSKTFRWIPYQKNVGVTRFTVTALDPADSQYRTSQSVLIRVSLPDDLSTIANVAPTLDPVRPHTVRVNDPVVIELKGIDLNGSVPTIEVPELPEGATLLQDPRFEEIHVLKFVPEQAGLFTLDVLVRDSEDEALSTLEQLSVTVLARDAFARAGEPLKTLAANRNLKIGFAGLQSFYHRPDGAVYADTAAQEFNIVTPENSMKMDYINPESGRYQFAATDNLIAFARQNDMEVHAHPLIWYRQVPAWIELSPLADRETHMVDFITRIMGRYGNDIGIWDVVNEPMDADGSLRDSVWLDAMGEDYIDTALTTAREASATATLLINEYDIGMTGPKFDGLMTLVDRLQADAVPLDGIGFQLHLFTRYDQFAALRANFTAVAERGLDVYITELDVSIDGSDTEAMQAEVYRQIMSICLEQERCKSFQMWGFTDQYSFRTIFDPLPFDKSYMPKPAYGALQEALQQ